MPTITSELRGYDIREGMFLEWGASRVRMGIAKVAFGSAENYVAGGVAADFKSALNMKTILHVAVVSHNIYGYQVMYDESAGKIRIWGQEPTNSTSGVIALTELAGGSTVTNNKTVYLLVFGTT